MREIKFRGKTGTVEGKKWVYGYLYKIKSFFSEAYQYFIKNEHLQETIIDEETIGQYTGLKDKNGQEIYEGDIVYIKGETELLDIKGKVEYNDSWAQFVITNTGNIINETEPLGDYEEQDLEVIGNIYNNPELLKNRNIDKEE